MRRATVLWFAFVAVISLAPLNVKYRLRTTGHFHEAGHFFAFLLAAVLICSGMRTPRKLICFGTVCCFAVLLEALETQFYRNRFEWHDVFVDALGAAAGLAVVSVAPLILPACVNHRKRVGG